MTNPPAAPRVARADELHRVVQILVGAFYDDPTWAWVFPDPQQRYKQQRRLWQLQVQGAVRYPGAVWLSADATATALWIPPGGTELSAAQESELEQLLTELLGADADRLVAAFQVFTDARPTGDDFYYLTMLGTDPQHRGHGHGLRLLHDTLQTSDRAGACAYLEASNPANVDLYARFGFRPHSTFQLPRDGPQITTMWRGPR